MYRTILVTLLSLSALTVDGQSCVEEPSLSIHLDIPAPQDSAGGNLVANVNDDGKQDFVVTVSGHLAVHNNSGKKLWIKKLDIVVGGQSESQGLPRHDGPGVAAGDVDGDGRCEVVFLIKDRVLRVVDGSTGNEEATLRPPIPSGAVRWELAKIANFRGTGGDTDMLLQATNKSGYRTGKYLAAYAFNALMNITCQHRSDSPGAL